MNNLTIGSSQGTLGDSCWLTPIFKVKKNCVLKMFDNPHCRNMAQIYDGIVERVEFCDNPGVPPTTDEKTHVSQRMLNALGITEVNCIPEIKITDEELAWAKDFLKDYPNPIVFVNHNSGWKDPSNFFARIVKPPKELMQYLANEYSKKYTIMQFCNNPNHFRPDYDNFDPLENAVHIRGLTLRQQAACYKVIGKMVTGDTGDPYLMLATGGKFIMLLCPEMYGYFHHSICYYDHLWKDEKPRTKYFKYYEFNEKMRQDLLNLIDFDF